MSWFLSGNIPWEFPAKPRIGTPAGFPSVGDPVVPVKSMRRVAVLLAAMATSAAASPAHEHTLPNGLRLLVVEDHAEPVVTLSIWYRVGSRDELAGATGQAHVLEHMLFRGTQRYKPGEIMSALDRLGADWNATTSYDYTNFYETIPSSKLDFIASLEAERMAHSLIDDAELSKEMTVVRNELEQDENSPQGALTDQLWATAFLAHPYHHPVIGWLSDLERVSGAEVRNFYRRFYRPGRAVISIVGDVTDAKALATITRLFGPTPRGPEPSSVRTREPPQIGERRVTIRKPGEMPVVALAWKAPAASDPDTIPLKVAQLVLSGALDLGGLGDALDAGISNRLYQGLVNTELCTQASVDYSPMEDPSLFVVFATPRNDTPHEKVEATVHSLAKRLVEEPVPPEELARAKARAQAAYGLMEDGTSGRAMLLGYFATIADWRLAERFPRMVQEVTAADVQRVAKRVFVDDHLTVGDFVPTGQPSEIPVSHGKGHSSADSSHGAHFRTARRTPFQSALSAGGEPRKPQVGVVRVGRPDHPTVVTRAVLPNGLVVLVRENHANPTFAISGTIQAGGAENPPGQPRLAELTASALLRGTKTRSRLDIARTLEDVGASLEFRQGPEEIEVAGRGLGRDFEGVFDILAEALRAPSFPEEEVKKLARETLADLDQAEDDTQVRARRALMQALYPKDHAFYIYDHAEEAASVAKIDAKMLRAFYAVKYSPDATAFTVVGDVRTDEVITAAVQRFGDWTRVGSGPLRIPDTPLRANPGRTAVFLADKPNADVLLGHSGSVARLDPDFYATDLACFALGGAASSRLFKDVRDKLGLSYSISSDLAAGRGRGPFIISLSANPTNVDAAVSATEADIRALVEHGIDREELRAAKDTMLGRYRVSLATNQGVAVALAALEEVGLGPEYLERQVDLYEAVTREQASEAARRHFHPDGLFTAIAGAYAPPPP
jgi:zinc protease